MTDSAGGPAPAPAQTEIKRAKSIIRAEISQARLEVDLPALQTRYEEGARLEGGRQEFLLPLARLHEERDQSHEALTVWRRSFAEDIGMEAAYNIMRHAGDQDVAATVRESFGPESVALIERLLRDPIMPPGGRARHIAICG